MQRDAKIFELIQAEKNRQLNGIELIASENFTSEQVMEATGSILTNNMLKVILANVIMVAAKWLIKWNK